MKKYIHIKTDGTVAVIDIPKEGDAEYRQLSGLVGGYIEQTRAWGNHRLVINEEGHLKGLALNAVGTALTNRIGSQWPIVGDAVLVGPVLPGGEFATVDPKVVGIVAEKSAIAMDSMMAALMDLGAVPDRAGITTASGEESGK